MYDVLAVSQRIINYSHKKEYSITNHKLQCLLYFVQVYFLIELDEVCFEDKIGAWSSGPVILKAYNTFKQHGLTEIPEIEEYPILFYKAEHKKMIHKIVDTFEKR